MIWRTDRGLTEPPAVAVIWLWAVPAGIGPADEDHRWEGTEVDGLPSEAALEPVARRFVAQHGEGLFDPIEFALVGGWAFLTGAVPRSTH